jgi:hypothetical protein
LYVDDDDIGKKFVGWNSLIHLYVDDDDDDEIERGSYIHRLQALMSDGGYVVDMSDNHSP